MLSVEVMFSSPRPVFLNLTLTDQTGTVIRKFSAEGLSFDGAVVQWTFKPGEVSLWYSVGLGAQPLYTVLVEVVGEVTTLHFLLLTTGLTCLVVFYDAGWESSRFCLPKSWLSTSSDTARSSARCTWDLLLLRDQQHHYILRGLKLVQFLCIYFASSVQSLTSTPFLRIPIDSFLSTASDSRYRAWLELLVTGNQNMIRCWGGGVYEDDSFYNICVASF